MAARVALTGIVLVACAPSQHDAQQPTAAEPAAEELALGLLADAGREAAGTDAAVALTSASVQQTMQGQREAFRRCHEAVLRDGGSPRDVMAVRIVIGVEGTVTSVTPLSSTVRDRDSERCILEHVRSLHFPSPDGRPVAVTYPISFEPGE